MPVEATMWCERKKVEEYRCRFNWYGYRFAAPLFSMSDILNGHTRCPHYAPHSVSLGFLDCIFATEWFADGKFSHHTCRNEDVIKEFKALYPG